MEHSSYKGIRGSSIIRTAYKVQEKTNKHNKPPQEFDYMLYNIPRIRLHLEGRWRVTPPSLGMCLSYFWGCLYVDMIFVTPGWPSTVQIKAWQSGLWDCAHIYFCKWHCLEQFYSKNAIKHVLYTYKILVHVFIKWDTQTTEISQNSKHNPALSRITSSLTTPTQLFLKRERNTQVYHLLPQTENWGTCICHLEGHMPTEQRIPGEQNGWKEGKETLVMVQLQNQIVGAFQLTQILTQVEGGDYVNRKEWKPIFKSKFAHWLLQRPLAPEREPQGKVTCWVICPHLPGACLGLCASPHWGADSMVNTSFPFLLPGTHRNSDLPQHWRKTRGTC